VRPPSGDWSFDSRMAALLPKFHCFALQTHLADSSLPGIMGSLAFSLLNTSRNTLRNVLVCAAFLVCAGSASAGKYQKTLDKKSHVWNDDPQPWEECNWAGGHDRMNLATGPGTLTWYNDEKGPTTRTRFTAERLHFVSKLTGTMLRGRWEGVVELMDADGRVSHALFDNGKLTTAWAEGPAPAQAKVAAVATPERKKEQSNPETIDAPAAAPTISRATPEPAKVAISRATPEPAKVVTKLPSEPAPAASRTPTEFSVEPKPLIQNSSSVAARSTPVPTKSMLNGPPPSVASGSLLTDPVVPSSRSGGSDPDLFHSLAAPASLLQHRASLSPREAAKIAEAELARDGLNLADYPGRQLTYNPDSDTWIVSYEHGAGKESAPGPARVAVTVDDKSGKATTSH
jgi:hypothetical protein